MKEETYKTGVYTVLIEKVKKDKINLFKSIENLNIVVSGGYPGGYSMVCFGSGISLTECIES